MRTIRRVALAALCAGLASCASMQMAEKNLEEGRLLPQEALAGADFLNEYRHPLPAPRRAMAGLHIALERRHVLIQGGKLLVQVGISTSQPALRQVNVHALAFSPADPGRDELEQLTRALEALRRHAAGFSVDLIQPVKGLKVTESPLIQAGHGGNLKKFLAGLVRQSFDNDKEHHVVLLVGSYKGFLDLPGLTQRERQDIVDLGRILTAKSVTLSVLSVGEKPDFAFLQQLADTGRGTFNVATDSLDYDAWIKEDLRARSAESITEVQLAAQTKNGARLCRVLAPRDLRRTDHSVAYALSALKQGQQRVLLAELEIPARQEYPTNEVLHVELKYYVPSAKRYFSAQETVGIEYVYDANLALQTDEAVARSVLILKTEETVSSVAREIRNRRNYQAIALLTSQSRALKQSGELRKDRELLRDASVLAKYAERLYDFDGEWLKSVKIWHDLGWDTDRFRNTYK